MQALDYLKQFESRSTIHVYMAAIKKFLETIYNAEAEPLEEFADRYLRERSKNLQQIQEDIQGFITVIKDMPPKTRRTYLGAVKIFLLENGIELPQLFWRRLKGRIKGAGAVSEEKVPNKLQLRAVMMHLPVQGKALFLTLLSSGMRIGEALKLRIEDLDFSTDPVTVHIRAEYTKTGEKRLTFISREAKEAVQEWLKVRGQYVKAAVEKSHLHGKKAEDERLFPFTSVNARVMWRNALNKTGNGQVDPRTKRMLMRPHVLRKFFRGMLGKQGVDMAECLMGHRGYLTEVYRKYPDPEKTLAEFYKQNEHLLWVFTEADEITKKQQELDDRLRTLQALNEKLQLENMELKAQLNALKADIESFKASIWKKLEEAIQTMQNPEWIKNAAKKLEA